ncbi:putative tRNA-dihydrouridine synthase B [Blattamonas nauphoetae]|uniref:tRNA-dihydrouridine(16/17) synthase [NAD(P)(+)] n=1 Tax=Blattamonas nauphoetae TaxID=2049346 RepID=A0ABQ9XKU4_9EUKA|nr:putative tRNA-dihydrouridine synthase B [Blattamonas nauphoetae]
MGMITIPLMIPRQERGNLRYYDFWRAIGAPKYVLAPMVDVSELPLRLFCLQNGTELCYSPMYNCKQFAALSQYRTDFFQTCPEDSPLFVQFCGDNPEIMLEAARYVENHCDAVDVNFGCPQGIAKRGHYGAFLQDEWDIMRSLVHTLHTNLKVPVTAKFRKQNDPLRTVRMAEMLRDAGAQVLCMHGRTREEKGRDAPPADWEAIRLVREALVGVPFIANGSVYTLDDAKSCLEKTKADAVMAGDGMRKQPSLFSSNPLSPFECSRQLLTFCAKYPTSHAFARDRTLQMNLKSFEIHYDLRDKLAEAHTPDEINPILDSLEERIQTGFVPDPPPPREKPEFISIDDVMEGISLFQE